MFQTDTGRCRATDNQLYILGEIDGVLIATPNSSGGRRPRLRHSGEFGISVPRKYWRLGIGSRMLDALIEWAREAGIVKTNLRVRTDNRRAIRLYEGRGFRIEGTSRNEIFLGGHDYDYHWMGLEL